MRFSPLPFLLLAIATGAFGCLGVPGSGVEDIGDLDYGSLLEEQQDEITRLQEQEDEIKGRFKECKTCEKEARRKIIQAQRCRAVMCSFEMGNTCNWRSGGQPGMPKRMLAKFLAQNPDYAKLIYPDEGGPLEPEVPTDGKTYPLASGDWAETLGGDLTPNQMAMLSLLTPEEIQALTDGTMSPAEARALGEELAFSVAEENEFFRRKLRRKRQLSGLEELLEGVPTDDQLPEGISGLLDQLEAAEGPAAGPLPLESLGVPVSPGAREAQILAAQLEAEGEIPPAGSGAAGVDSDRTWGSYDKQFGNKVSGIQEPAEGSFFGTTWVYPGETAVMETDVYFTDDAYYLYFDSYEATNDIQLRMCCDGQERCTVKTPWTEDVDTREWRKRSGVCPRGTKKVLFVCENVGDNRGACGIDNIQLFTKDGINYCEGVDLLAGAPLGEVPESIEAASSAASGSLSDLDETEEEAAELLAMLQQLGRNPRRSRARRRRTRQ